MKNDKSKLFKIVKKAKNTSVSRQTYIEEVNEQVSEKYKYGEEKAILRKTLMLVIEKLDVLGVDISIFDEFKEYNQYVEDYKSNIKEKVGLE